MESLQNVRQRCQSMVSLLPTNSTQGRNIRHEIRQRLTEQLKCLDTRHESQLGLIADVQEYFKRRSEIEFDYARQLERLYDRFTGKQKPSHTKDMQGPSPQACWNTVLQLTRSQYRQHTILSQVYGGTIVNSFTTSHEELQKIFKKSKELTMGVHDELMKVMSQLQKDIKTYHTWHAESKAAESRLRKTEAEKQRQEEKRASARNKALEKQREKHFQRFQERAIESTKARNDYILSIEASNAALRKYFENDVTELIDCLDLGYIRSTRRTFRAFLTAEMQMKEMREDGITKMTDCVNSLNALNDKQLFMESNSSAFVPPQTFHFQPHGGDEMHEVSAQDPLHKDLCERFHRQEGRLKEVRAESEEILKTLNELKKNWEGDDNRSRFKDEEVRTAFKTAQDMEIPIEFKRTPSMRRPPKPTDTENYFLDKYKEYLKNTNIETRLQARYDLISKALGHDTGGGSISLCVPPKPRKPRPMSRCGAPLFGGDLRKYIAASGQDIPVVVLSCIDHIRDFGLHHQGIFRVGGSQSEINDIKSAFEKGEDPLPERGESADINSVASVLKLYFRELPEPLFPTFMFKQFMECMDSGATAPSERISMVKNLIEQLPDDIMIVMRYLLAFLKHLSQYSDENMMDSHNLAICFGPTLMPTPPNVDTLCYQGPINELIGTIIRYQENIFPRESGRIYEEHGLNDADISPSPSLDTITDLGSEFGDEVNSVRHFDVHNNLNDHYQQLNQADPCPIVNQHQNAEADSSTGHVGHQGPDISPWLPRRPSGPLTLSDPSNPLDVVIEEPKTAENKPNDLQENSYKHMVQEIDDKMANNLAELDEIPEIPPPTHTPDIVRDAIKAPVKVVSPPTTTTLPKPAIRPKPVRPLPNQSSSLSRQRPSPTGGPNKSMTL
ncbi:SLIT-ROBO Rho GTPase-activating protein 3-like isoform X2 [Anneissia japonica]|uniref:SLIT-ROBO Rho GTPase-activating protein 3-like isoform X2 n=1 Tax=Anneissia japonica TaxID=1529436 RepID=UPI0014254B13|nr:SLIT-ROBO Rho GTPase-activating protein 3-like isoform X2 [Anneissia japonica]